MRPIRRCVALLILGCCAVVGGCGGTSDRSKGEVQLGMTRAKCRELWGDPRKRGGRAGGTETWCYSAKCDKYLMFRGDKLIAFQE